MASKPECGHESTMANLVDRFTGWKGYECPYCEIARLNGLVADHEEVHRDHQRLVRDLDVLLNGDGAARQASLCDIVSQIARAKHPETSCVGSGDPANCPENEGRGCCEPNPVAWRRLINSPYEKHSRYGYSEEAFEGGEPLYARPALKASTEPGT